MHEGVHTSGLGDVLTEVIRYHSVFSEFAEVHMASLKAVLFLKGAKGLECVADECGWMLWPSPATVIWGMGMLCVRWGISLVFPASMHDRPLTCECGKPWASYEVQVLCARCAMVLPLIVVGARMLKALLRPVLRNLLMLTCKVMLFFILLC
jgi:hypothetical protein